MATTPSPPPPPQQDDGPKPTDRQEREPPTPEPPHSETLEAPDPPNPEAGDQEPPNPPPPNEEKNTVSAPEEEDQPPRRETEYRSGTTPEPPSEPAALAGETDPLPLASPVNPQRRPGKRKKGAGRHLQKLKKSMERVKTLTGILNPIPFEPRKTLDFDKHEEILRRLGLWEFSKIEFDRSIRADLLTQLIATYDPKRKCSYVNDFRINVNRAVLARALKLPKQEKGSGGGGGVEEVDLDSEVFSDEAIGFIEEFVSSWLLLHDGNRPGPPEVANMTRCIKDGHPEKLDSATLIWFMVEKELAKGDTLTDCHYASHLQHLIRSQREEVFSMEMEVEEAKEEDEGTAGAGDDVAGDDDGVAGDGSVKVGEEEEKEEKTNDLLVQECNLQLNLGADAAAEEDSTMVEAAEEDSTMVEAAEEDSTMMEPVERNQNPGWFVGDHFLQPCQGRNLHSFEPEKLDFEPEKPDEQVEEDEPEPEPSGPHGYDMEANNDSMDRDGLTGNFLQGMETSHIPFGSQPDLDLFEPRDGSFMAHGGPSSFFSNGSKRPMEHEEIHHHNHQSADNKRLKTEEPADLVQCFDQMQQWMEKAKMMYESQRHSQFNQQFAISQLQERQELMETVIKTKNEELQKKHTEVFRLERELYLMGDLLAGYRKALNDTRARFAEYRKQHALREEPLYRDAGPGGLVLSVGELEKQRVKLEEDRARFIGLCRDLEQQWGAEFEAHSGRVLAMADKLACVEGEVRRVKELWAQRAEAEEGRKSGDGLAENDAAAGVAEPQEAGGGEE